MRPELAVELLGHRDAVAVAVTDTFLAQNPTWVERYGERARLRGEEDARHHIDFLAAAVDIGSTSSFADYVRWCRGVLESRGISGSFLAENLEAIGAELARRLSADTAAAAAGALAAGLEALAAEAVEAAPETDETRLGLACRLYTDAAISGRRKDALAIVREALSGGTPVLDIYTGIFQASLYEVGRRWATTGLSVAEEHMASATTQFILSALYEEVAVSSVALGNAVVTGVSDELHQIGANIVADALDAAGWNVRFLGTNMPHAAILEAVAEHEPMVVGISSTIVSNVGRVRDLIVEIRAQGGVVPRIVVGGGAFRGNPELWLAVGADGFAPDVAAAVALVAPA